MLAAVDDPESAVSNDHCSSALQRQLPFVVVASERYSAVADYVDADVGVVIVAEIVPAGVVEHKADDEFVEQSKRLVAVVAVAGGVVVEDHWEFVFWQLSVRGEVVGGNWH